MHIFSIFDVGFIDVFDSHGSMTGVSRDGPGDMFCKDPAYHMRYIQTSSCSEYDVVAKTDMEDIIQLM